MEWQMRTQTARETDGFTERGEMPEVVKEVNRPVPPHATGEPDQVAVRQSIVELLQSPELGMKIGRQWGEICTLLGGRTSCLAEAVRRASIWQVKNRERLRNPYAWVVKVAVDLAHQNWKPEKPIAPVDRYPRHELKPHVAIPPEELKARREAVKSLGAKLRANFVSRDRQGTSLCVPSAQADTPSGNEPDPPARPVPDDHEGRTNRCEPDRRPARAAAKPARHAAQAVAG
jgi:hypothetical protein